MTKQQERDAIIAATAAYLASGHVITKCPKAKEKR
jgi:hypothetical protein